MHERTAGLTASSGSITCGSRLIVDFDELDRVFGDRARVGDDCSDPFAGVAHDILRQRVACNLGSIDADRERIGRRAELFAGQYVMHAAQRERGLGLDRNDTARSGAAQATIATCFTPANAMSAT